VNEAEFRELVDQFTTHADKKDYVELPAFQKLLAKVFPISSLANTPEVTGNLFNSLDTDKDGVLSMPEFLLVRTLGQYTTRRTNETNNRNVTARPAPQ
jgi:Ca2+-binding EF-hand superfamily protein